MHYVITVSDMHPEWAKILCTFGDSTLRFLKGFLGTGGILHNFNTDPLRSTGLPIYTKH